MKAEHIMIGTADYSETLTWYQEKLGFKTKREWTVPEFPKLKLAYLERDGFVIEVVASPDTPKMEVEDDFEARLQQPGIGHLAFLVDDVDAVTAELFEKSVKVVVPPTSFPDSGRRLSFIEDNNGNLLEFLTELQGENRESASDVPSDEDQVRALTNRWLDGWNIGTKAFNPDPFREIFAQGEGAIEVYDNVGGDVVVIRSIDDYLATWTPFMEELNVWSVALEQLSIKVEGDTAFTTFRLMGTDTRGPNGKPIPFGQYGTHIWKKLPSEGWRIVHEHFTIFKVDGD